MAYPKRTFGQHVESGLISLGQSIHKTVIDAKNHELEDLRLDQKLGFCSDEDKLRSLKRVLYESATSRANPEHIQNLTRAIATISNQLEAERNHRNSFTEKLYGILNSIILLGILAASFSFPMAWSCNLINSQSKACQVSRIVPYSVIRFFSEPTK